MSQPKKAGQCAYCAEWCLLTDDHIPPKNLFPKPRASNLITVPCCEVCRKVQPKDDEYFRAAILSSKRVSETSLSQGANDSLLRSLGRPNQRGFAKTILASIEEVESGTETGIYLGREPGFRIDKKRIDRVSQRIVRGLFFHEKKYPVPAKYEITTSIEQFGLTKLLSKLTEVSFPKIRIIQNGVFGYTFKETEEDPDSGIWLLWFYEVLPMVGFVRSHNQKRV